MMFANIVQEDMQELIASHDLVKGVEDTMQ